MSINRITISGNLIKDCELRWTQKGKAVTQFCVAVNDGYKAKDTGEWISKPNFINCVIYDKRAETLETYLVKGLKVMVDGKLSQSVSEKNGEKRYFYNVVVDQIEFLKRNDDDVIEKNNEVAQDDNLKIARGVEEQKNNGAFKSPSEMVNYATEKASKVNTNSQKFSQQQMSYDASLYDEDVPF